jgi:hypothetical protein
VDAITLILLGLTTARLTRLVTTDVITEPARVAVIQRLGVDSKISYLINCDWCSSIYVGTGVASVWHFWGGSAWVMVPAVALSVSFVAGFLNSKADD